MQKWEYLFVHYERSGEGMILEKPHLVNGQPLTDKTKIPNLYDFSNYLGDQGWEMVAAPNPGERYGRLIFKRPKNG